MPRCETFALQMKRSTQERELGSPEPTGVGKPGAGSSSKCRKVGTAEANAGSNSVQQKSGQENEDSNVKVGFYNANSSQCMRASVGKPGSANDGAIDKWIEMLGVQWREPFVIICTYHLY